MADAAKNAFNSIFEKSKEVVGHAVDATKGIASQAQQAVGKIIPGAAHEQDPNAAATSGAASDGTAAPPANM